MYLETVCILLVLYLISYLKEYLKWRKDILIPMNKMPHITRYPIIGTVYIFIGVGRNELFMTYAENVKKMPPLYASWNGNIPEVNFKKPEHLEVIMNSTTHITKAEMYRYITPWLGEGLLTSKGSKWQQRRKMITPTFHFQILENFVDVFAEKSKILIDQLDSKANGEVFNIFPNITLCTLDIICETAMGVSVDAMRKDSDYVRSIYKICELIGYRLPRPYLAWDTLFYILPKGREFNRHKKFLHNFSRKVISDRKEFLQKQPIKPVNDFDMGIKRKLTFLDLLLESSTNNKSITLEDIREEVDTFMFEGHDTTTAAISWTIFALGNNPDIQNKAFSEVQGILGEKSVPTSISELNQMKYLECVIKESLRLYPSVPVIARTINEDVNIDEYKIPRGATAVLHIHHVHRDPNYFPNPEKFDPDRFLPENCVGRHPFAYIPFSAGPRNCIGQKFAMYEEKTILASILKNFEIKSIDKPQYIKLVVDVILKPANGVKVILKKRNNLNNGTNFSKIL